MFTDAEPVFFFFSEDLVLAKLMSISLVLFQFQFDCFTLSVFKQFTPKVCILWPNSILCELRKTRSVVCPEHAFVPS